MTSTNYENNNQITFRFAIFIFFWLAGCITLIMLPACSKGNLIEEFSSADEALSEYITFHKTVESETATDTRSLISTLNKWQALDDSVFTAITRDSLNVNAEIITERYFSLHDSIVCNLELKIDSRRRNLTDYYSIISATIIDESDHSVSVFAQTISELYENVGKESTYGVDKESTIKTYESMLADAIDNGFSDRASIFTFLQDEDIAFRSFLDHLPDLGTVPLSKVRDDSKTIMGMLVQSAGVQNPVLTTTEVVVIMTLRNNRRLIQNAERCVKDIADGVVKKGDQSTAYQWMLLQPWVSFDKLSYALMTDEQKKSMEKLARDTDRNLSKLKTTDFPIDTDTLPSLLIKTYIFTR